MLDEAEEFGRERRLRQWPRTLPAHLRRHLDDVVVCEPGQNIAVAHVDHLDVTGVGGKRCHELDRGLAVERSAALLEERGFLGQRRVPVHAQELALDRRDGFRARDAVELLPQHLVHAPFAEVNDAERKEAGDKQANAADGRHLQPRVLGPMPPGIDERGLAERPGEGETGAARRTQHKD